MKRIKKTQLKHIHALCALALIGVSSLANLQANADPDADQVKASFERELNHETVEAADPTGQPVLDDILYTELNAIHWTEADEIIAAIRNCEENYHLDFALNASEMSSCVRKHMGGDVSE